MSLNILSIYIVNIPNPIPYILFLPAVGYERIIELNMIISYRPVHSNTIFRTTLLGKCMESSTINVFMPIMFNILLEVDATLKVPMIGKFRE